MDINYAIRRMDLQGFNKFLLEKRIGVTFPVTKFMYPHLTWEKHGYQGTLTIDELKQHIFDNYKREISKLDRFPHLTVTLIDLRIEKIDLALSLVNTVEKIEKIIEDKWYNRSIGSYASYSAFKFREYIKGKESKFDNYIQQLKDKKENYITSKMDILLKQQRAEQSKRDSQKPQQKSYSYSQPKSNFTFRVFTSGNNSFPFENNSFGEAEFMDAFFGNAFFGGNFNQPRYFYNIPPRNFTAPPPPPLRPPAEDPYEALGLPQGASENTIKKRYHSLALKLHPDRNRNDPKAKEKFQRIQNAYESLVKAE